jgi:hypothetical protein
MRIDEKDTSMNKERRKTKRLCSHKDIQVILNCTTPFVGRIHDISAQGLSVVYEGKCQLALEHDIVISIFEDTEMIGNLRCRPVYNIPTLTHGRSFRGKEMGLLGVAYARLNPAHHAKLNRLLESVTMSQIKEND